jgi:DNA-binding MarR family transcriptional regulator
VSTKKSPKLKAVDKTQLDALARFRRSLREVLADSEEICIAHELTAQRFQALLAIENAGEPISVGDLASDLILKHHSAVELADRLAQAKMVERLADKQDKRRVLLRLTPLGAQRLHGAAAAHLESLERLRETLTASLQSLTVAD